MPTFLRTALERAIRKPEPIEPLEKIDESLTPNMRALRLAMSISEQLLSMGVAASDVVHMALGITLIAIFPFTRLIHIISAPIWYFGRRYQIVREKRSQ